MSCLNFHPHALSSCTSRVGVTWLHHTLKHHIWLRFMDINRSSFIQSEQSRADSDGARLIKHQMETKEELVVFVKELLQQRPSRQMLKIYLIGSTLALLGAVAGLIQIIFTSEEEQNTGRRGQERPRGRGQETLTELRTEEEEEEEEGQTSVLEETKGDDLQKDNRRSSANRLHAS